MDIDIFDIVDGKLAVGVNTLSIPELKAIVDEYEDPFPPLQFLYFTFKLKGPYSNVPEANKEEVIMQDYPGDYSLEDEVMIAAYAKVAFLSKTPIRNLFKNAKTGLERLSEYLSTASISEGKDGNLSAFTSALTKMGAIITSYKLLEAQVDEESGNARGSAELGYDET